MRRYLLELFAVVTLVLVVVGAGVGGCIRRDFDWVEREALWRARGIKMEERPEFAAHRETYARELKLYMVAGGTIGLVLGLALVGQGLAAFRDRAPAPKP